MKHYFQVALKPITANGVYLPPKGVVCGDDKEKGLRASQVAENLVFATLTEAERDKFIASTQHVGIVDIEG